MKIYLDTCCYGRPYDDQSQEKILQQSKAILKIRGWCLKNGHTILGSVALEDEIGEITDIGKYNDILSFYRQSVTDTAYYVEAAFNHVEILTQNVKIRTYDKLHLSFAVAAGADYLLTTDEPFEKACAKLSLSVRVVNPLKFILGGII